MRISHSGNLVASINDFAFKMNDMLLVLDASKNLLSVSRLCSDNYVTVEFDDQRIRIHDRASERVLAEGKEVDGVVSDSAKDK